VVILEAMSEISPMTSAGEQGDPVAAEQLLPLVYDELRRLAAEKLDQEKPGQTLEATALVHEAYLRLMEGGAGRQWNSRGHFFAAAAEAMRRILIENARRKRSHKRGGGFVRHDLEEKDTYDPNSLESVVSLDEALTKLAATNAKAAELVRLRYYAGLPLPTVAELLGVSPRTADRMWVYARAWLHQELQDSPPSGDNS